jgi:hypothetical protein
MARLTLLLIPIVFLSSCTIDWNDEKDKKIAELAGQLNDSLNEQLRLSKAYTEFQKAYSIQTYSGNLLEVRNAECQAELKKLQNQ